MKKQQRRYDFWGNKIKYKKEQEKKEVKDVDERKHSDPGLFGMLILVVILGMGLLFISSFVFSELHSYEDDFNLYTVQIYIPDCENGELFLEINNVQGQYLINNGLAERTIFSPELTSSNFAAWDKYVNFKTGSSIPSKYICVVIELES